MDERGNAPPSFPKARELNRFIAKTIDILIVFALSRVLPPVGFWAGLTYLLIADGFFDGRSLGKRLVGLKTVLASNSLPQQEGFIGKKGVCSFKESMIRNSPLALGYIFFFYPMWGGSYPC